MSREAGGGRRSIRAPLLIAATAPVCTAIYWALRERDLLAQTPIWVMAVLLIVTPVINLSATSWAMADPSSGRRMQVQCAASAITTATVIYATGWGSMLVVAYALGTAELLRTVGARGWRSSLGWNFAAIAGGELAVALGLAPTLVDPRIGVAVAIAGASCLFIVIKVLGTTAEARESAEAEVRDRGEHFESLIRHAVDLIGVVGDDQRIRSVSPAIGPMLGYESKTVEGAPFEMLVHPTDIADAQELVALVVATPGESVTTEVRLRHRDGSPRVAVATLTHPEGHDGEVVVNIHDVTTQRELEQRLRRDAMHDPLTGLLNRGAFVDSLDRACARAGREGSTFALLYLDLDGFKEINDHWGHQFGDRVLVEVSGRLRDGLRGGEVVGRLGGDEFVVLVESVGHPGIPIEIADRLLAMLADRIGGVEDVGGVSASIGIATCAARALDAEGLMSAADGAMYEAKRGGRGRWALAAPELGVPLR